MLTEFETQVHTLARDTIAANRRLLMMLELYAELEDVDVINHTAEGRTSELRIVFRRGRKIDDIMEFFIEKSGVPVASLDEVSDWLRSEFEALPLRHAK